MESINKPAVVESEYVTIVYKIVDNQTWATSGNPLRYEHNGLKAVCVSAGDLASFHEDIETVLDGVGKLTRERHDQLYRKHVMACFPQRS